MELDFGVMGKEGSHVSQGAYKGKGIAVFTSGGDSQGMNSAVRAVVRMGIYLGARVYFIKEGYQGLCDGGSNIQEASWSSVSGIISKGGTVIGSARCMEFRERAGRLKAAKNLIKCGITNLVCIGGDGSLTGANTFRNEWSSLIDELHSKGEVTKEEHRNCSHLNIVGIVGSIDNDFCGTDMTVGADSALHRIIEATDAIGSTAYSHRRTFILEVMGRHCGYLAVVAALASEADYVFIPEWPAEPDWQQKLCKKLTQERDMGQRLNIILVAEGATDREGNPITADMVKKTVVDNLNLDARVTVLGHVQRGGNASAFDRVLGCRMGAEAVLALFDATPDSEAVVVTLVGNHAVRVPMMSGVEKTQAVAKAMANKDWGGAVELRGRSFARNLEAYKMLTKLKPPIHMVNPELSGFTLAVMHVGAPCCGMNAAVRSFVRTAIFNGNTVLGIHDGFDGLLEGNIHTLKWMDVMGFVAKGGAYLGIKRTLPDQFLNQIALRFKEYKIQGLTIIGGFEAFNAVLQLAEARDRFPEFRIPMVVIPATISNNVPGTDFCLGVDTALNEITNACDRIKQSAQGTKRRVFVIETHGGYCGYLATMAGLASGADAAYIYEEKFSIKDLQEDVRHMYTKMAEGVQRGLILRNEKANENYTTDFLYKLYSEEGTGVFSTRVNVLGHVQQGGSPSPFDRNLGLKIGAKACTFILQNLKDHSTDGVVNCIDPESAALCGIIGKFYTFTAVEKLKKEADFKHRVPKNQWWLSLRNLLKMLARHGTKYSPEEEAHRRRSLATL